MTNRRVGSRELKTRLGRYLHRVRMGETIIVTDHAEPVAELRPISGGGRVAAKLARLGAEGLISPPIRRAPSAVVAAHARQGASAAAAVRADRDGRG